MNTEAAYAGIVLLIAAILLAVPGVASLLVVFRRSGSDDEGYTSMRTNVTELSREVRALSEQHIIDHVEITRLRNEVAEIPRLRNEVAYLRQEVDYWKNGVRKLKAGEEWEPRPDPVLPTQAATLRPLAVTVGLLERHFSDDELASLAMDIGLDLANVPGDTKRAHARGLAELAERQGVLAELVAAAKAARPKAKWD